MYKSALRCLARSYQPFLQPFCVSLKVSTRTRLYFLQYLSLMFWFREEERRNDDHSSTIGSSPVPTRPSEVAEEHLKDTCKDVNVTMLKASQNDDSYHKASEKYLNLLNELYELGASVTSNHHTVHDTLNTDELLLDLPRICVAGNQSVGKSSLLENIAGVSLPRGDGTCTRCVMEIRLSTSSSSSRSRFRRERDDAVLDDAALDDLLMDPKGRDIGASWNCTILLQKRGNGNDTTREGQSEDQNDCITHLFASTSDPAAVGQLVQKAQKALLNPSRDPSLYLLANRALPDTLDELLFTQDSVILEITGSHINLSLIDLPGIVKSVPSQKDQHLVPLIESLITSYISFPNTLILAVFTCKDDMENQQIFHMARQVDPTGKRTIGVLTKPDTIEKATHERWINILSGRLYSLKLGYYMVKMQSKGEMQDKEGQARSGARSFRHRVQDDFFRKSPVWTGIQAQMPDRFGIESLQTVLASLLTGMIEASLPRLKQSTQHALQEVNQSLDALPNPPGPDAKIELLQIVRHYSTLVSHHINAQQNFKVFNQKIKKHYEAFKDAILSTRPRLVIGPTLKESAGRSSSPSTTSLFWKTAPVIDSPPKSKQYTSSASSSPGARRPSLDSYLFTMDDLKTIVSSQKGKELDGHAPYSAFEHIVKKSQIEWKVMVEMLMNCVSVELENLTGKLVVDVFGRFPLLKTRTRNLVQVLQSELKKSAADMIGHCISMESRHPFTLASLAFINGKQRELDRLEQQLVSVSSPSFESSKSAAGGGGGSYQTEALKRAVNALHEAGLGRLGTETLVHRLSSNPHTNESFYLLDLMASAVSYFDISSARFIDGVCLQMDYHYLLAFTEFLERELVDGLEILTTKTTPTRSSFKDQEVEEEEEVGKSDGDRLASLLVEDSFVRKKREALRHRKTKLQEIWRRLQLFGEY